MTVMMIVGIATLAAVVRYQGAELDHQQQRAAVAEHTSNLRLKAMVAIAGQNQKQAKHLADLAIDNNNIRNALSQRQQTTRRLERENPDYKNWADTKLPVVARRLRQRPALTGSADYQQFLSHAEPVQPAP